MKQISAYMPRLARNNTDKIGADIIEAGRFKGSKHFVSYLRSAPRAANSNMTVRNKGTNKMGKKAGLVRTGLRRRVFAEIHQMLKKGGYHYGRDPRSHEIKTAQYRRFLGRQKNVVILQKTA